MPCLAVGELGVGLGIHNEEFVAFLVHTIALGGVNMVRQTGDQNFCAGLSEYLIPEDENMMLEEWQSLIAANEE